MRLLRVSTVVCVTCGFLFGCKDPTESQAGSCGGSSEQSLMPVDSRLQTYWSGMPTDVARGLDGVGGVLAMASGNQPPPSLGNGDSVSLQGYAHCTVNVFDASGWPQGEQAATSAQLPNSERKLLLWTSRNCVDFSKSALRAYLFLADLKAPLPVRIERLTAGQSLGQKISDSVTAWRAAFASRAPAEAFVDVDNFERFVVTLPASTSSSDPGVARSVSAVASKLAEAFAARAQAAKAIMLQSPGRYAALTQWLEKTERQAMLRLVLAARKSGLSCGGGSDSGSCGTLRRVAFEEHQAVQKMLPARDMFEALWSEGFAATVQELENKVRLVAEDRAAMFAQALQFVQRLGVSLEQTPGSPRGAGALGAAAQPQGGVIGLGASATPYDIAILHGFHRSFEASEESPGAPRYTGWPLVHLFSRHQGSAALVELFGSGSQGNNVQANGVRGLRFGAKLEFSGLDEGQMLSFGGLAPAAFVSLRGVTFGQSALQSQSSTRASKKSNPYSRTNCN